VVTLGGKHDEENSAEIHATRKGGDPEAAFAGRESWWLVSARWLSKRGGPGEGSGKIANAPGAADIPRSRR
jgi:hypothetical protein